MSYRFQTQYDDYDDIYFYFLHQMIALLHVRIVISFINIQRFLSFYICTYIFKMKWLSYRHEFWNLVNFVKLNNIQKLAFNLSCLWNQRWSLICQNILTIKYKAFLHIYDRCIRPWVLVKIRTATATETYRFASLSHTIAAKVYGGFCKPRDF